MNAITQTETQAIATVNAVTDTITPERNLIRVPLLQNLTVILARDGEHYDVVAGGRTETAVQDPPHP